jgi:colicin import membrane protein
MSDNNTQLQTAIRAELRDVDTQLTELEKVEAGIAELTGKLKGVVYDVKTPQGMRDAIAGRALARTPRLEVERIRKAAKAPVLELGRNIDARAKRISEQLVALEDPIDDQIKVEEQRKEAEKAAKLEAERQRIATIQERIADVLACPGEMVGKPAAEIFELLERMRALPPASAEYYAEFQAQADQAKADTIEKLQALHAAAEKHEAEQAQLLAERVELDRLRREDQERRAIQAQADAVAREQAERAAAEERRKADEAAAAERARLREEEERQARERREREDSERRAREEEERIAAEQRGREMAEAARQREAEAAKLAAERAEFERRKREQAERELEEQLAKVTLVDAAQDAVQLLRDVGQGEHLVTVKLARIVERENRAAAA